MVLNVFEKANMDGCENKENSSLYRYVGSFRYASTFVHFLNILYKKDHHRARAQRYISEKKKQIY